MSPIRTTSLTLHRRILISSLIAFGLLAAAAYILFQARFLIEGPLVSLMGEPDIIQHERQIVLEGVAKNITAITLNGRPIVTNESGFFREPLVLENGYTRIRIDAEDRFGRAVSLERTFVYVDSAPEVTLAQ